MPFDGHGFAADQPLEKLDAVIELLATPRRWCKGVLKTRNGQHCIRGALMEVDALDLLQPVIMRAIHEVAGRRHRRIEHFNDHPNTDHEQVLAVLHRARAQIVGGTATTGYRAAGLTAAPLARWHEAFGGGLARLRGWLLA